MTNNKLAIVVGGGPAPGINSVIGAASIRANLSGIETLGLLDGYSHIMLGDTSKVTQLDIESVSRIHFRGGSILRTARANPTKKPEHPLQYHHSERRLRRRNPPGGGIGGGRRGPLRSHLRHQ